MNLGWALLTVFAGWFLAAGLMVAVTALLEAMERHSSSVTIQAQLPCGYWASGSTWFEVEFDALVHLDRCGMKRSEEEAA